MSKEEDDEFGDIATKIENDRRGRAYQIWSYSDTGHELTVEEQMFVRSYVIDRNPVAALRRIGYSEESAATLRNRAERMLANPEVQGSIEAHCKRIMDALDITAEKVNQRVAAIAFFDPGEVMEFDHLGVRMMHSRYWTPEQRANVAGVKMGKEGIEVKLADRQKALDFLGKQLNLVNDEKEMARAAAEAASRAAIDRIMEVTGRMQGELSPPKEEGEAKPSLQ